MIEPLMQVPMDVAVVHTECRPLPETFVWIWMICALYTSYMMINDMYICSHTH